MRKISLVIFCIILIIVPNSLVLGALKEKVKSKSDSQGITQELCVTLYEECNYTGNSFKTCADIGSLNATSWPSGKTPKSLKLSTFFNAEFYEEE